MAGETELIDKAGQVAQQGAQQAGAAVQQASGGIFGFLKGVVMAPFNVLGGLAKGAFNGLIRNTLIGGGILSGIAIFCPDLIGATCRLVGKPEWAEKLGKMAREGGATAVIGTAFATAAGVSAAIGGAQGAVRGLTGSEAPQGGGGGMGNLIGGSLAIAAVTAVAIGAFSKDSKIQPATGGDHVQPPPVPGDRGTTQAKS